jgi:DNA polymerase-3 subunit gamma/tau
MSYQVLARKWRPRFFDEMVGQEHVLRALINALNEGRLHHAYLFTGTRGVGKTTIARILAKCLNCEQGVSARPCGECSSCKEIAEGRFVDLIEVDAASRTRVEDTRELLDNVQYAPTRGRYKVYLIDEVHMLSTHSFNALLKTLEEPPEHVKFLLATTDPQKLPVTVLSRCLQFSLKNMTPERIVEYLGKVLQAEKIGYEESALWSLGRAAQGSMRDALSLTDQAIAYGEGDVSEVHVNAMLGTMDRGRLFRLAGIMAKGDAGEILAETSSMAEHSPDYDEIIQGLLHIWHRASLAQVVPDAIENTEGDREAILQLSMAMPAEDLQLCYQIALQGRKDLALAPDPRQGFEMILLRMLAFRPAPDVVPELDLESALEKKKSLTPSVALIEPASSDLENVNDTPAGNGSTTDDVPVVTPLAEDETPTRPQESEPLHPKSAPSEAVPNQQPAPDQPVPDQTAPDKIISPHIDELLQPNEIGLPVESIDELAPSAPSVTEIAPPSGDSLDTPASSRTPIADILNAPAPLSDPSDTVSQAPELPSVATQPSATEINTPVHEEYNPAEGVENLAPLAPHTWYQWVEYLPLAGLPMAIAKNSAYIGEEDGLMVFDVDTAQSALYNDSQKSRVESALQQLVPGAKILMTLRPPRGETPEQRRHRLKTEALYGAKHAIDSDPVVNQIINDMGGQVLEDTVRPNT